MRDNDKSRSGRGSVLNAAKAVPAGKRVECVIMIKAAPAKQERSGKAGSTGFPGILKK